MTADIEEGTDAVCVFADDDDLLGADLEQEIIALVRDPRYMSGQNPFLADHFVHISLEHRIAGVEFLLEAIANAGVSGEPLHQGDGCFTHQILIRALVGSYSGLSDAVAE